MTKPFLVRAWADYSGQGNSSISFTKGTVFWCFEHNESGWAVGEYPQGKKGWFPFSYVRVENSSEAGEAQESAAPTSARQALPKGKGKSKPKAKAQVAKPPPRDVPARPPRPSAKPHVPPRPTRPEPPHRNADPVAPGLQSPKRKPKAPPRVPARQSVPPPSSNINKASEESSSAASAPASPPPPAPAPKPAGTIKPPPPTSITPPPTSAKPPPAASLRAAPPAAPKPQAPVAPKPKPATPRADAEPLPTPQATAEPEKIPEESCRATASNLQPHEDASVDRSPRPAYTTPAIPPSPASSSPISTSPRNGEAPELGKPHLLACNKLVTYHHFASVALILPDEARTSVPAHLEIVKLRCPELLPPKIMKTIQRGKRPKGTPKVDIRDEHLTAKLAHHVLLFIYTGQLTEEISDLTAPEVMRLAESAQKLKLQRMVWLCEDHLLKTLRDQDTVLSALRYAHENDLARMRKLTLSIAAPMWSNKEIDKGKAAGTLGPDLFTDMELLHGGVGAAPDASNPLSDAQFDLGPAPPDDTKAMYRKLLDEADLFGDAVAVFPSERVKFHRALFMAHSPSFNSMLEKSNEVSFQNLSVESFKSLLRYLYYEDSNIAPACACELISFSKTHNLASLQSITKEIVWNNINGAHVSDYLSLAYRTDIENDSDMAEIKKASLNFVIDNLTSCDLFKLRSMNPRIGYDLVLLYQDHVRKTGGPASARKQSSQTSSVPQRNLSSPAPSASEPAGPTTARTQKGSGMQPPAPGTVMVAIADFTAKNDTSMSFRKGDQIIFSNPGQPGSPWVVGSKDGKRGWVPLSYFRF